MALKKVVRHPPVYSGDLVATVSGASASGAARGRAINTPTDKFFRAGTYLGEFGYLTIDERGDWTYTKTGTPSNGATETIHVATRYVYKGQQCVTFTMTFGAGSGGGPVELASADFANGVYRLNGVSVPIGDLFVEDTSRSAFDPAINIQPDVGMTYHDFGGPAFAPSLAASLLANGCTFKIELHSADGSQVVQIAAYDSINFTDEFTLSVTQNGAVVQSYDHNVSPVALSGDEHIVAYTLTATRLASSADGGAVQSLMFTNGEAAAFDAMALGINGDAVVRKITIYAPQADADLPALSYVEAAGGTAVFSTTQYVPDATPWTSAPTGFTLDASLSNADDSDTEIALPDAAAFTIDGVTYTSVFVSSNATLSFGIGHHLIDPDPTARDIPTLRFGAGDRATGNVYKGYDAATNAYLIRVEGYDYYTGNHPVVWEYRFFADGTLMVSVSGEGANADNHEWEYDPPVSWCWSVNSDRLPGMETGLQLAGANKLGTSAVYRTDDNGASFTPALGSYTGSVFDGTIAAPPAPLAWPVGAPGTTLDFQAGVYAMDGVTGAQSAAILINDADWPHADPSAFVAGEGYKAIFGSTGGPRFAPLTEDRMAYYGFTMVVEFYYEASSGLEDGAHFDLQMFKALYTDNMHVSNYGGRLDLVSNSDRSETPNAFDGFGAGEHKMAITVTAEGLWASIDGGAVQTLASAQLPTMKFIGFNYAPYLGTSPTNQYLRAITVGEPQAPASLPALSA